MGLILLPLVIIFAVITALFVRKGFKGAKLDAKNAQSTSKHWANIILLSSLFAILSLVFTLLSKVNENLYQFDLVIYILFTPMTGLIILGLLLPKSSLVLRNIRHALYIATLFIFPLAQIMQEYSLPWFNILTHI
ncbi:hypothetical protein O1D97_02315 [Marinomonas sp. 15G1-11]|uniref:Uncharacterized protein n=1 Tax=Marinomonas phaeophyticola TaxID=3004091 RepID=A0ABT4JSD1_9GAMM|nr:hypothetical protein [Marinomonas sp. 15G1-11]MCZ2720509.1 hypothetical protein [Marinomonas sp. 15G1-11]